MRGDRLATLLACVLGLLWFVASPLRAEVLKPYVLGDTPVGNLAEVSEKVAGALKTQGFEIVGRYEPYAGAVVLCATNGELKAAAGKARNGGFGVAQRVAITDAKGKIQVSYVNPAYLGTAYGLGKLPGVGAKLKAALGAVQDFGSVGIEEAALAARCGFTASTCRARKSVSLASASSRVRSTARIRATRTRIAKSWTSSTIRSFATLRTCPTS